MTTHIGFWAVPALITLIFFLPAAFYRPSSMYDIGGAILAVIWLVAALVAWFMWGLSWLI